MPLTFKPKNTVPALKRIAIFVAGAAMLGACSQLPFYKSSPPETVSSLRFIGEQRLPWRMQFKNTLVGGLSGIDYDASSGDWVMICDDRSEHNPARYYRARLAYDEHSFKSVELTDVVLLKQPDGSVYPSKDEFERHSGVVPDLETMRVDPRDGSIWYASEGDVGLMLDPFVRHAARDGAFLSELPLPPVFSVTADHTAGPRNNVSFEGMSFAPDGKSLWVTMEGPMYQDGPEPRPGQGAVNRITHFGRDGKVLGQYAYALSGIPAAPGKGKFADNGVSESMAISPTRLLMLERSGVQAADGKFTDYVRLYEIDTDGATDIQNLASLKDATYQPVKKRLVLDLNTLKLPIIDNLEGMSFGPMLPNGHASLVLISDDNFGKSQVTQLLLFDVTP